MAQPQNTTKTYRVSGSLLIDAIKADGIQTDPEFNGVITVQIGGTKVTHGKEIHVVVKEIVPPQGRGVISTQAPLTPDPPATHNDAEAQDQQPEEAQPEEAQPEQAEEVQPEQQ